MVHRMLLMIFAAFMAQVTTADKMFAIQATYLGDQCGGTPYAITVYEDENCTKTSCDSYDLFYGSRAVNANMMTNDCSSDYQDLMQIMRDKFGTSPYLLQMLHIDENCTEFSMAFGYPAMGACVGAYNESDGLYAVASLNTNGSASLGLYYERTCFANQQYMKTFVSKDELATHSCTIDWFRWYSSNDKITNGNASASTEVHSSTSLSSGALAGIGLGGFGFVIVLAVAFVARKRQGNSRAINKHDHFESSMTPTAVDSLEAVLRGQTGLWNDDVITAKRIPRDKVATDKLISRGSFGEVYAGTFNERKVAVKMLLPAMQGKIHHVTDFLAEAKMTATMDHPHIVSFIGVAWDSLSDICVVLEFMDGGELRTLLDKYEKEKYPVGFNREKTKIALEVCHALTYLHSSSPSIIHRDLKSRNILLNSEMKAKLSDFGISRERLDRTMTAGVGTSLWMAPEVMLGERYDDKADVFSFGVVLSELDVHTLPYTRAKKENLDSKGHQIPDSILLQRVALGIVKVEFSDASPEAIVELGRACTSVYPTERPTAAEALYKLQMILSRKKSARVQSASDVNY
ncbi:TKL protein kinase [Phytophthora palmivora]|uniref:TKL protein kinase n=1 Tax=Phytophthora palmivora TaxID=4796 RepID=A0A2P4Y8U8_9STRA|nr:TKL protein kinase [Phytophthora palmivora]